MKNTHPEGEKNFHRNLLIKLSVFPTRHVLYATAAARHTQEHLSSDRGEKKNVLTFPAMSDSDPDPRFRIPRGSSDEEIDSDLASVASDPPRDPQLPGRAAVTAAAVTLRTGLPSPDAPSDLRDEDEGAEVEEEAEDAALSAVTYAATGRRDLSNAATREAREVLPAGKEMESIGLEGTEGRQKDMMAKMLHALGTGGAKVSGLADLKKKVARLSTSGKKELHVPVADHVAERIARNMAYEEVSREVTEKWMGVVQENRRKKHLVFPLDKGDRAGKTCANVIERFKPGNEYESEIADMLKEAGVGDENRVIKGEEIGLKEAKVTMKEILVRRKEMARIRSLMFHYEQRMRRIKKIKSRKYRRILKKEKEKVAEQERQLCDSDGEEEAIRAEKKRVEERMTLRHKNTSKWVRRQLSRGETKRNLSTKAAIEEQLQLHEQLKRRQEGLGDESDESDSEGSIGDGATDERLDKELEQLRKETAEEEEAESKKKKKKGLMSLRFMQAAEGRQRKQVQELLKEIEQGNINSEDGENEVDAKPQGRRSFTGRAPESKKGASKSKTRGQMAVGDDPNEEVNFSLSEDEGENRALIDECEEEEGDVKALKRQVIKDYEDDEKEGLLGMGGDEEVKNAKLGEVLMGASGGNGGFTTTLKGRLEVETHDTVEAGGLRGSISKAEYTDNEEKKKGETVNEVEENDGGKKSRRDGDDGGKKWSTEMVVERSVTAEVKKQAQVKERVGRRQKVESKKGVEVKVMGGQERYKRKSGEERREAKAKKKKVEFEGEKGRGNDKTGVEKEGMVRAEWISSKNESDTGKLDEEDVERMKLVAQAFAGAGGADEEEFAEMKAAEIDKEAPKAAEIGAEVLPGWGRWDGAGVKKRKKGGESAFARAARERLEAARANAISKRKDRKLAHVILDEKRVKRATELTMGSVPFPFSNAEQWEMELKTPVCKELMTGNGFVETVRPKVVKRVGAVIDPIREGAVVDRKRKQRLEGELEERGEKREKLSEVGRNEKKNAEVGGYGRGKRGVIDLRKEKARRRNSARKGLMM